MSIGIPEKISCRQSPEKPLDLIRKAIEGIDALADQYSIIAANPGVQLVYAQLDGAVYKLENIGEQVHATVDEDIIDDGKPLGGADVAKLIWGMLTKE